MELFMVDLNEINLNVINLNENRFEWNRLKFVIGLNGIDLNLELQPNGIYVYVCSYDRIFKTN